MTKKKNSVVVVAAHPDDEAIGCFGTLLKHYKFGDEINIIFLSDGVSSRGVNKKKKHERKKNCFKVFKIGKMKTLASSVLIVSLSNTEDRRYPIEKANYNLFT